jgi:predicted negative regulator of RcsB-dependent stress response
VVHEHLGDVYRALGRIEQAREQYRLGLEAEGENEDRLREKLRSVR